MPSARRTDDRASAADRRLGGSLLSCPRGVRLPRPLPAGGLIACRARLRTPVRKRPNAEKDDEAACRVPIARVPCVAAVTLVLAGCGGMPTGVSSQISPEYRETVRAFYRGLASLEVGLLDDAQAAFERAAAPGSGRARDPGQPRGGCTSVSATRRRPPGTSRRPAASPPTAPRCASWRPSSPASRAVSRRPSRGTGRWWSSIPTTCGPGTPSPRSSTGPAAMPRRPRPRPSSRRSATAGPATSRSSCSTRGWRPAGRTRRPSPTPSSACRG